MGPCRQGGSTWQSCPPARTCPHGQDVSPSKDGSFWAVRGHPLGSQLWRCCWGQWGIKRVWSGGLQLPGVLCWEILGSVLEGTSGDWWSCAGRYWDLCKGTSRVWDPGGDIRGCAGGCERGLCGAALGLCWGWGWVGAPAGTVGAGRGQRGHLGTGLLWHGTAVRSLQRGLRPCTDPAQAWVPLPAAPPAVVFPPPSPGMGLWRGAGLRPAVRGPVGQTLPSGPRGASAPAAHHGAASPSPCPQLCRHDPAGGGSEKTREKKGFWKAWSYGGGQAEVGLHPP